MATRRHGPFKSKAQWRWAFATHQPFAHRWAEQIERSRGEKTGYRSLPRKKGRPSATTLKRLK